ncbi:MAG: ABC transporter permease subunit [Thermomicrobiales bacterium]|nr:ABC transporter permease subunit [Thermomicrobiales bacterium]
MNAVGALTGRALARGLAGLIALLGGIALFEAIQPVVIESFGGAEVMAALIQRLPPALQAFARSRPEFAAVNGLPGLLSVGFTHPLYLVLAISAVVGFTARTLAGEMESGAIQIPLSRPVSRPAVYLSRVLGMTLIAGAVAAVGPLGTIAGLQYLGILDHIDQANFIALFVGSLALLWAIGGLALLGSAAVSTTGRIVGWALALLTVMYFVDYFAAIWSVAKTLRPLSLFAYYDPTDALAHGTVAPRNPIVLVAVGVAGTIAGLVVFVRRDLP